MACRGCSSSNQRSRSSYGCRKALQNIRWSSITGCSNGCTNNNCANCCGSCTNNNSTNCCGSCTNHNSTNCCGSCTNHNSTNCCCNSCTNHNSTNCCCNSCTNNNCANCCSGCAGNCIQPRSTSGACSSGRCAGSPFYTGPCGPVNPVCGCTANCQGHSNCCCNHGCCCGENCCTTSPTAVYGHFTQEGSLEIEAGGVVPFNGTSSSVGILKSGGELTLTETGAYMISLSVNIPANVTLSTDFVTLIDDGIAAGGTVMIDKAQTNSPLHAHAQTVVSAAAGSVIRVVSSDPVNLNCCDQIVVLTIAKVG